MIQMNLAKKNLTNLDLNLGRGSFGTLLVGLLCAVVFHLGVTLSADDSCYDDGGPISLPLKNIGEAGTGEGICTKFIYNVNIFSIARIFSELLIDPIFVK